MAFETFTGRKKVTNQPKVSILKQGNFNFNNGATQILRERRASYLQLLFDKDSNRIGFKPCSKNKQGAYKVRESKGGAQISGMAFLKHYQIPFDSGTRSYPVAWDDELKMFIINLA